MAESEISEPPGDDPENVTPSDVYDGDPFVFHRQLSAATGFFE
jgi:hypothetical protein